MRKLEILAPAGGEESLIAAVRSGCDAVYMGGVGFNARAGAQNFSKEAFSRGVEYCHIRGVKVYQTLNTLVFGRELSALKNAVRDAAEAGVDALIVQDLGVAHIVRECVPDIELHASTQMSITSPAGLRFAKEIGVKRAVIARELSKKEIEEMVAVSGIECEMFVHGAHCMSISGQCYMSALIGGRSGNRGMCAQPCRLPFQAKGGIQCGLSLKDMSLIPRIQELCELGVAALKIEGRMKRPEYVAAAVTACRLARDGGEPDMELLQSVFSRSGFTSGYFDGQIDKKMFGIRGREDVMAARPALKDAQALYKDEFPGVGISLEFSMKRDTPTTLSVQDQDSNHVKVSGEIPQIAINKPTDAERAGAGLSKLGGTPYRLDGTSFNIEGGLMLPVSALNDLRRRALEELTKLRASVRHVAFVDRVETLDNPPLHQSGREQPEIRVRLHSRRQLTPQLLEEAADISLPVKELLKGLSEESIPSFDHYTAEIPRILFPGDEQWLIKALVELRKLGVKSAWCGSLGAIKLALEAGMSPKGGYSLGVTNFLSLEELTKAGLEDCQLSFELLLSDARRLNGDVPVGILAYGRLPAMAVRNCPIKAAGGCAQCGGFETMTDRTGTKFMVDCSDGIAEIFNSVPLYLADRIDELLSFDFLTLYFTDEDAGKCLAILSAFRKKAPPQGDWTRGLYYRGVG